MKLTLWQTNNRGNLKEFAWHTNQVFHPSDVRQKNSVAYAQTHSALLRA